MTINDIFILQYRYYFVHVFENEIVVTCFLLLIIFERQTDTLVRHKLFGHSCVFRFIVAILFILGHYEL